MKFLRTRNRKPVMILREEMPGNLMGNIVVLNYELPESSYGKTFAIERVKLPSLPYRYARADQITVQGVAYGLPDAQSMAHLCQVISALKDNNSQTMVECFFADSEFEICTYGNAVTVDPALASLLQIPEVLAANTCYGSTTVGVNESDYYRIEVDHMQVDGFFQDGEHTSIVEEFRADEELPKTPFTSTANSTSFQLTVRAVKTDGTVVEIAVGDLETVCVWVSIN